jgi:hypothetical protein
VLQQLLLVMLVHMWTALLLLVLKLKQLQLQVRCEQCCLLLHTWSAR